MIYDLRLQLLLLLLQFHLVISAIDHQCVPFVTINDNQGDLMIKSSSNSYINITVGRRTSVLIYEVSDIQHTNIPLKPHPEGIKQYDYNFTVCGLQDLDSGYCFKDRFGLFTVREEVNMNHPFRNELLEIGSTLIFNIPYDGVWCTLVYQDDSYLLEYHIKNVQHFGNAATLDEYNELRISNIVIGLTFIMLILVFLRQSRSQINRFTTFMIIFALAYHVSISSYLWLTSISDGDPIIRKFMSVSEIFKSISNYLIFDMIYACMNGEYLPSSSSTTTLSQSSDKIRLSRPFTYFLLLKILCEKRPIAQYNPPYSIILISQSIVWLSMYKKSLETLSSLNSSIHIRDFKRFQKSRATIFIVPLVLKTVQLLWNWVFTLIAAYQFDFVQNGPRVDTEEDQSYLNDPYYKAKLLYIFNMERKVHNGLIWAIPLNLQKFEYLLIIVGLMVIWRTKKT